MSIPSFDTSSMLGGSLGGGVSVRAESNPSGAEARVQGGATCRTPCALQVPAGGVTSITFTLQGYLPQTIPVNVTIARESFDLPDAGVAEQIRIEPNPVFAQLEIAPPPPPARRRAAPPKPRPQAQSAPPPQQQAAPPPAQSWGPPPGQPGFR
jgi:hypothetical protein